MKQAVEYKGYALVDILQPCLSFNKANTYAWYNERVYELGKDYDSSDKTAAIQKAMEFEDKIPVGVIFREEKSTFHEKNIVLKDGGPLIDRKTDPVTIGRLIKEFI